MDLELHRNHFAKEKSGEAMTTNAGTLINSVGLSSFYSKQPGSMKRRPTIEKITPIVTAMHSSQKGEGMILFPRLKQFSHFHYDHIDFESIKASLEAEGGDDDDELYSVRVEVSKRVWVVYRAFNHFIVLDRQLHTCVFDREFSKLINLQEYQPASLEEMNKTVASYLDRISELSSQYQFYCGTVLNFFEVDSRGNRLMGTGDCSAINIPAIAAAQVVKKYTSQAPDELSLEVGDMVSVIDKPRPEESTWWRGKKRFEFSLLTSSNSSNSMKSDLNAQSHTLQPTIVPKVGFFPSDYVEIIGSGGSTHVTSTAADTKPVLKRRGKLISFLRVFFSNRPNRTTLKQNGIVKERIFGCDLSEHLSASSHHVPHVVKCCTEVIEHHGLIDGIYRLSGVASNIQRLRAEFDECTVDTLEGEDLLDLHTITAVLKMYFRELPNPLLTYQLYDSFSEAVEVKGDERLLKIKNILKVLPPPHYRTAKHLFAHLHKLSTYSNKTGMDTRNLAIVWSPNLMRSKVIEGANVTGPQMLASISIQATIIEAMISSYEYLFGDDMVIFRSESNAPKIVRPKSAVDSSISSSNKLLTLAEAQERASSGGGGFGGDRPGYENGSVSVPSYRSNDSDEMLPVFRTVIDFDTKRNEPPKRTRDSDINSSLSASTSAELSGPRERSPSRWRSFFHRNRHSSGSKSSKNMDIENWIVSNEVERAGGEDITENEIGHLSRPLTLSTGNINAISSDIPEVSDNVIGVVRRWKESTGLTAGKVGQLDDGHPPPVLMRAGSHESFFEVPFLEPARPPLPSVDIESPNHTTLTPGVTFKKGYAKPLQDLLEKPKVTWKEARPLGHSQTLGSQVLYLPKVAAGSRQALIPNQGPAVESQQAHVSSYRSATAEEEENLYEPIDSYLSPSETTRTAPENEQMASTPCDLHVVSTPPPVTTTVSSHSATERPAGGPQPVCAETAPLNPSFIDKPSVAPTVPAVDTGQASRNHGVTDTLSSVNSSSGSMSNGSMSSGSMSSGCSGVSAGLEQLQLSWVQSDVIQCVNQGEQVSLSRSFSSNSSETRSSRISNRRTFTDSIPEVATDDDQIDYPIYANIDPLGVKKQLQGVCDMVPSDCVGVVSLPGQAESKPTLSSHCPPLQTNAPASPSTNAAHFSAQTRTYTPTHPVTLTNRPVHSSAHTPGHTSSVASAHSSNSGSAHTPGYTSSAASAHSSNSGSAHTPGYTSSAASAHSSNSGSAHTPGYTSSVASAHSSNSNSAPHSGLFNNENETGNVRPRAYSSPYKMPQSSRRKETNVDIAIADAIALNDTSKQHGRKPTRKMEYVNMRSYDADPRRLSRTMSEDGDRDAGHVSASSCSNTPQTMSHSSLSNLMMSHPSIQSGLPSEHSVSSSGDNSGSRHAVEPVNDKPSPRQRITSPSVSPFSPAYMPLSITTPVPSNTIAETLPSTECTSPQADPFSIFGVKTNVPPTASLPPTAAPRKSLASFTASDND